MSEYKAVFGECFCGNNTWDMVYFGPVREGAGTFKPMATVLRCSDCEVERLDDESCKDAEIYETGEYRKLLSVQTGTPEFYRTHDSNQAQLLSRLGLEVRGKVVADVGAAAGSLLAHMSGLISKGIAVEPCKKFHQGLKEQNFWVYSYAKDTAMDFSDKCDLVFSIDVIEHVGDPVQFLKDVAELLAPGGKFILLTPNRDEILMKLAPEIYAKHFYRTVHTWYFNRESLRRCVELAGLKVEEERCIHRFGISNTLSWLKDAKPTGHTKLLDMPVLDSVWQNCLEAEWLGDNLCFILTKGGRSVD